MGDIYKPWVIELKKKADIIIDLLSYYEDGSEMVKQGRKDIDRSYERAALARNEAEIDEFEAVINRYYQMLTFSRNKNPEVESKREVSIRFEYLDKLFDEEST
jgi:hypothetical protein